MSNTNIPVNSFKKGNEYHKLAARTGRPKRYATPDDLWKSATAYFEWNMENPIRSLGFRYGKLVTITKQREMSLKALHAWLGVSNLYYYHRQPDFRATVYRINYVVQEHNFTYAAAGLLKGRSVGHTVRNVKRRAQEDSTPFAPKGMVANATSPLRDIFKENYIDKKSTATLRTSNNQTQNNPIDTKKVGIPKQKLFTTTLPLANNIKREKAGLHSPYKRYISSAKLNSSHKYPVDTKKVRILRHSKNRIPPPVFTKFYPSKRTPT